MPAESFITQAMWAAVTTGQDRIAARVAQTKRKGEDEMDTPNGKASYGITGFTDMTESVEIMQQAGIEWTRFGEPARTAEAVYEAAVAVCNAQEALNQDQLVLDKAMAKFGGTRDLHNIELKRFGHGQA